MVRTKQFFLTLILICFQILWGFTAQAQELIIPSGNVSVVDGFAAGLERKPLGSFYGFEQSAIRWKSTEITQVGSIHQISFFLNGIDSIPTQNLPVRIFMKKVDSAYFDSPNSFMEEIAGSYEVFDGEILPSQWVNQQWVTITLQQDFVWENNGKNLEIIVESAIGAQGNETISNKSFYLNTVDSSHALMQCWQSDNVSSMDAGTLNAYRPNVKLNFIPAANCSQPTGALTLTVSAAEVCPAAIIRAEPSLNLNASNESIQWQISTDGVSNWTNIQNGNGDFLYYQVDSAVNLRYVYTCNSISTNSPNVSLAIKEPIYCYCHEQLGGGCTQNQYLDKVEVMGTDLLNFHDSCVGITHDFYSLFPANGNTTATLVAGQSYKVNIRSQGVVEVACWLDENRDGILSSSEFTKLSDKTFVNIEDGDSLHVSDSAFNGLTMLRFRTRTYGVGLTSSMACNYFSSGETEDYLVTISGGINGIPDEGVLSTAVYVYPNPVKNEFYLSETVEQLEILDVQGKSYFVGKMDKFQAFSTAFLPSGVYILKCQQPKQKTQFQKLVVLH